MTEGLDEQITEVKRELGMRRHNYPRWVSSGRMEGRTATRQVARLQAVLETLEQLRCARSPSLDLDG